MKGAFSDNRWPSWSIPTTIKPDARYSERLSGLANDHARCSGIGSRPRCDVPKRWVLCVVLGTCVLALLVNLSVFGVTGLVGAVTLQVIGHAKTCLVLAAGFVFFPSHGKHNKQQL